MLLPKVETVHLLVICISDEVSNHESNTTYLGSCLKDHELEGRGNVVEARDTSAQHIDSISKFSLDVFARFVSCVVSGVNQCVTIRRTLSVSCERLP